MEDLFGQEWDITPAGGATGAAFIAQYEEQRLFLKRNTSPFLAVLSAEGIVPKLVWTKRLENGDVFTAQQWLEGRELKAADMVDPRVAKLLNKIHRSEPLLSMLKRLGKTPLQPAHFFEGISKETGGDPELSSLPEVKSALAFLEGKLEQVKTDEMVVCHGDVNHNNWLLGENGQLYLIDWDGAIIGDPAIDLGMLLYSYIPRDKWEDWLGLYGQPLSSQLELRMKWYVIVQALSSIMWHKDQGRYPEMEKWQAFLRKVL